VYERGVSVPIFAGATSKAILAHLSGRGLKRIYLENEADIRTASQDVDWKAFSAELARIRTDGYAITISELRNQSVGIASPILREDQVVGSLALIFQATPKASVDSYRHLAEHVVRGAQQISKSLERLESGPVARQ
jgi:DNA-binding IclR family transcriptional regulator